MRRLDIPLDIDCWMYALYTSHADFDAHHRLTGELCDYGAMRSYMIVAITDGAASPASWFSIDLSWLEWPDIDLSSIFEFFDVF